MTLVADLSSCSQRLFQVLGSVATLSIAGWMWNKRQDTALDVIISNFGNKMRMIVLSGGIYMEEI